MANFFCCAALLIVANFSFHLFCSILAYLTSILTYFPGILAYITGSVQRMD